MIFVSDFLLKLSHFLGKELHGTAATGAHHVVVAASVVLMFVARNSVVKGNFGGESTFGEKLESAVDSGVADAGIFLLH